MQHTSNAEQDSAERRQLKIMGKNGMMIQLIDSGRAKALYVLARTKAKRTQENGTNHS